jgi:hypothetical protein
MCHIKEARLQEGGLAQQLDQLQIISYKQWLRIIENKKIYRHGRGRWTKGEGAILESSPAQFARDLERIGESDPNRVVRIALHFSEDVDNHYISAVYHVIGQTEASKENPEKENWRSVEVDVAQQLHSKFICRDDISVATSYCRALMCGHQKTKKERLLICCTLTQ